MTGCPFSWAFPETRTTNPELDHHIQFVDATIAYVKALRLHEADRGEIVAHPDLAYLDLRTRGFYHRG